VGDFEHLVIHSSIIRPAANRSTADVEEYRKNWARLIQKIYEADPLLCPKRQGRMRIISSIEDPEVIKKVLTFFQVSDIKTFPDRM
jgi:hypothetical protein